MFGDFNLANLMEHMVRYQYHHKFNTTHFMKPFFKGIMPINMKQVRLWNIKEKNACLYQLLS